MYQYTGDSLTIPPCALGFTLVGERKNWLPGHGQAGKITEMLSTNLKTNSKQVLHLNAEYWRVLDW